MGRKRVVAPRILKVMYENRDRLLAPKDLKILLKEDGFDYSYESITNNLEYLQIENKIASTTDGRWYLTEDILKPHVLEAIMDILTTMWSSIGPEARKTLYPEVRKLLEKESE